MIFINPIIKYCGGKKREIKIIKDFFPKKIDVFIEPFIGGGSVYFYLNHNKNIINDLNNKLITTYKDIKYNHVKLIKELKNMKNEEKFYYSIRNMYNNKINKKYLDSSIYLYINRTSYRGMIRYNSKGEFNVPFGRYKTYKPWNYITQEHINLLNNTDIYNTDFSNIFKMAKKGDFIFLDPPYLSNFSDYTGQGFDINDHKRLYNEFINTKANCMLVISDLGQIREMYKDYIVYEYEKKYSINIGKDFKPIIEKHLIICNY